MSARRELRVSDPTLYRVLAFQAWSPQDNPGKGDEGLERLLEVLEASGWRPRGTVTLKRAMMAGRQHVAWNSGWEEVEGCLHRHWLALAHDEKLAVLAGIEEDGEHVLDTWVATAGPRLDRAVGLPDGWREDVAQFRSPASGEEGPVWLGEAVVVTGELADVPKGGWEALAQERYGPGAFTVMPWGCLGEAVTPPGDPPRLEVLALKDERANRAYSRWLYGDLLVILLEYLKVVTFVMPRYRNELARKLQEQERTLQEEIQRYGEGTRQLTLNRAAEAVHALTERLTGYSSQLFDLAEDIVGVEIARDTIAELLATAAGKPLPEVRTGMLSGRVDLYARQLQADRRYFELTQQRAVAVVGASSAFVEIEETRAQRHLAIVAIIVGVFLGVGEVLPAHWLLWEKLLATIVPAGALGAGYWLRWVLNR